MFQQHLHQQAIAENCSPWIVCCCTPGLCFNNSSIGFGYICCFVCFLTWPLRKTGWYCIFVSFVFIWDGREMCTGVHNRWNNNRCSSELPEARLSGGFVFLHPVDSVFLVFVLYFWIALFLYFCIVLFLLLQLYASSQQCFYRVARGMCILSLVSTLTLINQDPRS